MLAIIFHKIWDFEKKILKNAKMSFFFEQDPIFAQFYVIFNAFFFKISQFQLIMQILNY